MGRGGTTASLVSTSVALPLQIQTAIVKSSICLSTVKAGYRFNILRNESELTNKSSKHHGPWLAPHFSECTCPLLNFVFELEICTSRAPQELAPVQATKKSGSKMPLRLQVAMFVPH